MDRRELAAKAREAARALGVDRLGLNEFTRRTGIGSATVYRHFRRWPDLCREAGLKPAHSPRRLPDDEVFAAMRDAFVEMGGIGTCRRFEYHFRHGIDILLWRHKGWTRALYAFRDWARKNAPEFPYMDQLPETAPPPRRTKARAGGAASGAVPAWRSWPQGDGRALGEVINFRAALHAPVNESGVMVLFGMMAEELGFSVETVAPGFPDCEAKRRIAGGRWQRVRIEFEFRSRNFRDHGHDPAGCDLVVCWTHDWDACPIEVIELKSAIAALRAEGGSAESGM